MRDKRIGSHHDAATTENRCRRVPTARYPQPNLEVQMRGRRLLVAVAAVLLAGAALPGTAVTAGAGMRATSGDKVTFTVGMTQDVDSLNPFTGIAAASYEIYQMQLRHADRLRARRTSRAAPALARAGTPPPDGSPGPTTSAPA